MLVFRFQLHWERRSLEIHIHFAISFFLLKHISEYECSLISTLKFQSEKMIESMQSNNIIVVKNEERDEYK